LDQLFVLVVAVRGNLARVFQTSNNVHDLLLHGLDIRQTNATQIFHFFLEQLGCAFVSGRDVGAVDQAIRQFVNCPPPPEVLARNAVALEPQATWRRHVETNLRSIF
jgi:hypothetical protein